MGPTNKIEKQNLPTRNELEDIKSQDMCLDRKS